jgi:3-hydroxybutyrate dehydrogenase
MSGQLDGRVALVTGGTRGLGRAIADAFLREGARVMVTGRSEEKGRQALTNFGAGAAASFVAGDVTRQADSRPIQSPRRSSP